MVEVENASKASGANVQQWESNGASSQNWILEPVADPGCSMDTGVIYTFENANSGLVMDIADGKWQTTQIYSNGHPMDWIVRSGHFVPLALEIIIGFVPSRTIVMH